MLLLWGSGASAATQGITEENYAGRDFIVYVPSRLPPPGTRALVVVLHGGLGNAQRIVAQQSEHGLNLNAEADQDGFLVAYLNGTPVTRFLGADKLGWNAGGGCCGQPAANNIDDVAYIKSTVQYLARQFAVDPQRVYGMGHSNGAIMSLRVICETGIYAAAISIAGPVSGDNASCPGARGKRILAIHGTEDTNVPVDGGRGTKGLSGVVFNSEQRSRQIFENSGASYTLLLLPAADHLLDHIGEALQKAEGVSIAQKAVRFFGLSTSPGI